MENENHKPNRYARRHPKTVVRPFFAAVLRSPLVVSPMIGITSHILPSHRNDLHRVNNAKEAEDCLLHHGENGLLKLRENWRYVDAENLENALGKAKKVKATVKDDDGNTVLHFAARYAKPEVIPVLINHGAEANAKNKKDDAPLHWAAEYANAEMISALYKAKANLNITTQDDNTPLHLAVEKKRREVVCALIEAGANVKAKNAKGLAPLYYAVKHKDSDIAELLKVAVEETNLLILNRLERICRLLIRIEKNQSKGG